MKSKIAIAAPVLIRTDNERPIVLKTIKSLSMLNIPLILTDGGSPEKDKEIIKKFPNVTLYEAKNLTNELIFSFKEASKVAENIFYLQTDKQDFAEKFAPTLIKKYLSLKPNSILIPTRTAESVRTYPKYQVSVENFLNFFISDYIGVKNDYFARNNLDYYLGPKIFPSFLIKYLDQIQGDIGWGTEAFLYVLAKRLKLNFEYFPLFIKSPKDIGTEEEIKLNRLNSVTRQLNGFYQGLKVKL